MMAADVVLCMLFLLSNLVLPLNCDILNPGEVLAIVSTASEITRDESGSLLLPADEESKVLFVGRNFSAGTELAFTNRVAERGSECGDKGGISRTFKISESYMNDTRGLFKISLPANEEYFYICVGMVEADNHVTWVHQGKDTLLRFKVVGKLLPMWLNFVFVIFLLTLSGLFSGLNLGLMALDKTELKIIERCGSKNEKKYAKVISPLRKRGNFLLCTLLLGNVLVNNTLTILLDTISNGLIAVISATVFIVIFGEIVPQALCSRHGLAVGAKTRYITMLFMMITFPVSFPISLLLDKILGEEIGQVYNREKLQELIRVTKDFSALQNDEVNIISGALSLTKKKVKDIMTRIEDVFMIEYNECVLNFETMSEIMKRGYSRIPVYDNDKSNIVALLNIKDLALIDPDDNTPLKTVCKFYQHHLIFVFDDHKLDQMLQDFRQGHSHMAIIRRVNNEGDGDPYYETLGVVTLEDVIEEIIQSEIIDETDTLSDNIKKNPRMLPRQDFSMFNQPDDENKHVLSAQLTMAAFQFLSTSVEPFLGKFISENVLKKLIKQNIVVEINPNNSEDNYIYKMGIPCDYFVLILQGHVEVSIGKENLSFNGGPFTYYGVNALRVNEHVLNPTSNSDSIYIKQEPYIPDFSVKACENLLFLRIKRPHYIVARRATLMGRSQQDDVHDEEAFTKEWNTLSKINQCNHNNADDNVTVHHSTGNINTTNKTKPFSDNWTPLPSTANIDGLRKRTDSRNSGWSFAASEHEQDPEIETSSCNDKEKKVDASSSDVKIDITDTQAEISTSGDNKLECSNHDRTSDRNSVGSDKFECEEGNRLCDNCDFNDEEQGSGEFTPLVGNQTQKNVTGSGDS